MLLQINHYIFKNMVVYINMDQKEENTYVDFSGLLHKESAPASRSWFSNENATRILTGLALVSFLFVVIYGLVVGTNSEKTDDKW